MHKTIVALGCALLLGAPAFGETLTNATVEQLVRAGIGDAAVIAKIKASDANYDLSTDQLIALKNAGVPGPVIAAMLEKSSAAANGPAAMSMTSPDPMAPHPAGVYMLDTSQMDRIDPTVTSQAKTGGILGYALTAGIASMSVKAAIANATARVSAPNDSPTFYFFFDESNPSTAAASTSWAAGTAATVSSPSEFILSKLMQKKGRREVRVGSLNIGGAKTGVMDKDRIPFDYAMVRPGVFKVTARALLEPGEYAFLYSLAGGGSAGAMTARLFDFSVPPKAAAKAG